MTPNVPRDLREALRDMQDPAFMKTARYQTQQWRANRQGLDLQLALFEKLLVRRMGKLNVPMFTNEAFRPGERQAELYAGGFSRLKSRGPHMVGRAVDIIHGVRGWDIRPEPEANRLCWRLIGHVGKEIIVQEGLDISWGGDWKAPWDPAHWERTNWSSLPTPAPF